MDNIMAQNTNKQRGKYGLFHNTQSQIKFEYKNVQSPVTYFLTVHE